jgi:RNA polymerase sigma-70 factor (ECF subfamily)
LLDEVVLVRPAAFAELYDRHSVAAYSLARRIVGPGHADDAVQEAFLTLWRNAASYDPRLGPVRPWLLGMVRNRSIDALRKLDVHDRRRSHSEDAADRLEAPGSTESRYEQAEQASTVASALALLPAAQRAVVELAYFGGLTQHEIADRLRIPLGTVKGRTRLAFDKLRDELELCAPG